MKVEETQILNYQLAYFPYFLKNKRRLMRSLSAVCVSLQRLKVGIVKDEAVSRQRIGKHVLATTNTYTTIEELLGMVLFMRSVP
jgi:hypothetical protein